ncbi:two-component system sensor histidine kinase CreC [Arenimonas sp. MALMAid1274]|uniref:two-component system sensor histidine kinase CreC n=1 Tax=Arenimonas sp. MALMAid1274 TaxID=3411630 RepID=UPI003BA110D6
MRIGLRILLGYFLVVALGALLVTQVFVAQVKPGVRQTMEDTLVDMANVLAELAAPDLQAGRIADGPFAGRIVRMRGRDPGAEIWGFQKRDAPYRIYVTDAAGIVVFDSHGQDVGRDYSKWNDVHRTLRGRYGARSTATDPADPESTVMHVAAPVRDEAGRLIGVLTVAKPNAVIAPFIERSQRIVATWGLVLLASALLIGLLAASWLSRQLAALRRYAQAVTAGERTTLPRTAGEFAELGQALETMRDKLEGKQYAERYVQDLTHEMKSPLAAIRASAELLETPLPPADQARFAEAIGHQSDRLAQMIDRLLALAAVEHRQALDAPERLDVAALLDAVAQDSATRLAERQQTLAIDAPPRIGVTGDGFLLRQALDNLVDNASAFGPPGSVVELSATVEADHVLLRVRDRGPGVPDFAADRVFERFYSLPRPDGSHRSSGLGLSFVREVAALHGGSASLENRPEGGACATLRVPLTPPR